MGFCSRRGVYFLSPRKYFPHVALYGQTHEIQHFMSLGKHSPHPTLISFGCLMTSVSWNVLQAKKVMGKVAEVGPLPKKV